MRSEEAGREENSLKLNLSMWKTDTHTPTLSLSHTHTMKSSLFWVGKYYSLTGVRFGEGCCASPALFDATNILILSFYLVCFCIYTFKSIINVFNMFIFLS